MGRKSKRAEERAAWDKRINELEKEKRALQEEANMLRAQLAGQSNHYEIARQLDEAKRILTSIHYAMSPVQNAEPTSYVQMKTEWWGR